MSELKRLENQAEVLMRNLELNSKKIRQYWLQYEKWDTQRIDANLRIVSELRDISLMINELKEYQHRVGLVG
jgi:hypothetical protein